MATYDLTRSELNNLLAADNIDSSVRQAIIDYLVDDGTLAGHHAKVEVQESGFPPLDPKAEVLIVDSSPASVSTDPNLKVIVDVADATLTVTGGKNVLVATGTGDDSVDLSGSSGRDVVLTGSGNDTVVGGDGADSIYGGDGNDSLTAGSGDRTLIDGGNGHDTLTGGSGDFDTIAGGGSGDLI